MPGLSTPPGTMYTRPWQERIYVQVAHNGDYGDHNVNTWVFDHKFTGKRETDWPVHELHFSPHGGGMREVEDDDAR